VILNLWSKIPVPARTFLYGILAALTSYGVVTAARGCNRGVTVTDTWSGHHGAAQVEAAYATQHQEESAKHEAEAKAHAAKEQELQANIATLKRELAQAKQKPKPVDGAEPGAGGDDSPVVEKLEAIVAEQDKLISEVTADRDSLRIALAESKLATIGMKAAFDDESLARQQLQAAVAKVNADAQREVARAEWRGGAKGVVLGALIRSLF
jgi:hypothetical protein